MKSFKFSSQVFIGMAVGVSLMSSPLAEALEGKTIGDLENRTVTQEGQKEGTWLFFGLDGGFSSLTTNVNPETDKDGYQLGIKALASFYPSNDFVFDAGVGWLFNRVETSGNSTQAAAIRTRNAFVDLGARYKLSQKVHLGLVTDILFGTDVSFSETNQSSGSAIMAGGEMIYEFWLQRDLAARVGAKLLTDVTIRDRQNFVGLIGFQIGLPFTGQEQEPQIVSQPEVQGPVARVNAAREVELILDNDVFYFDTAKSNLKGEYQEYVDALAKEIADISSDIDGVEVEGHTDRRGTLNYNLQLSKDRAKALVKKLVENGVPQSKVVSEGYGPTRPIAKGDTPKAWAKNRRVNLRLKGVEDPEMIVRKLNMIREQLYHKR